MKNQKKLNYFNQTFILFTYGENELYKRRQELYDDETLYFLKDHQIQKQVKTGKGPFQLLVREDNN